MVARRDPVVKRERARRRHLRGRARVLLARVLLGVWERLRLRRRERMRRGPLAAVVSRRRRLELHSGDHRRLTLLEFEREF